MERNLAFRRAAWHSSAANYDNTAHLVTSGVTGELAAGLASEWVSAGGGTEWVVIDLGAASTISRVAVTWGEERASEYSVQISGDAKAWTDADENAVNATARYVRVLCLKPARDRYSIQAIEVFGENDLQPARTNWRVARVSEVAESGAALSQVGYDDASWLGATVPGTVLSSYLDAGAVPNPNYDDWQFQISEAFFTADFWYRGKLDIKTKYAERVFLNFDAINWKADVWFNGHLLKNALPHREHSIEGAFTRAKFDVTDYTGDENVVAVYIYKNDTPGEVTTQGLAEGPGPNGGLLGADNPTMHAAVGWDWLPTIRGRDIGIYGDVRVTYGGDVELLNPWVETKLNLTETGVTLAAENLVRDFSPWRGADADGEGFTVDFGEPKTVGSVSIIWGTEAGGAAAEFESRHAAKFRLETSLDGETWTNFDAYPGGEVSTGWFGVRAAEAHGGTDALEGHSISDTIQGATARPVIDMGSWGPGEPVPFPVFAPQKARFVRFTSLERRELNGKRYATRVSELRAYAESPQQVEQSLKRNYTLDDSKAEIIFRAEVRNRSDEPVMAEVSANVSGEGPTCGFQLPVTLAPGETRSIAVPSSMINPRLWWPNTYGEQYLYTAKFAVRIFGEESDSKAVKFGVREFAYPIDGGLLTLYCNGVRIVCKGGNWGMDDGLKRDTPIVYDHKVRLHAEANMTMIRNWIGMTNHDAFYEACDKYGVLVWDDFWLANPVDGPHPNDVPLFLENAEDKILRYRSHAALALYCGRNEGDPPPEINEPLRELCERLDGSRTYFPCSAMPPVGSGGGYSLATPGGSRGVKQYFDDVSSPVLRSERGIPNVPELQSLRKFVAPENLWPISEVWALHDWTYHMNGPANSYMYAVQSYLGGDFEIPADNVQGQKPDVSDPVFAAYKSAVYKMNADAAAAWTVVDFSRAAQLINFENHRGLYDALAVRRSNGLLMWMSQSSWPSFMWQTYDYYLDVNGGYFGVKSGNQPTRAVWDPRDDGISLANATPRRYERVTTTIEVFDLTGALASRVEVATETLEPDAYGVTIGKADFAAAATDTVFLRLTLRDANGAVLGENTYWHNRREYQDYRALGALPAPMLDVTVVAEERADGETRKTVRVANVGQTVAVGARVRVGETLPVFYSDNYLTLMPGETRTITAAIPD
ncbi:MAG: discoidin domain-containing protein [Oscillospiraceae bacterium]|nr:discoidin domain-containing protein [Oscillospiraceae bacterium]